jgi:hypothetical protein
MERRPAKIKSRRGMGDEAGGDRESQSSTMFPEGVSEKF